MAQQATEMPGDTAPEARPEVEIGWVLVGRWTSARRKAAQAAAQRIEARLREALPDFTWRCSVVERGETPVEARAEPVLLLDVAEAERDVQGWDFVFAVTEAELVTYSRSFALAMPSRLFSAAVMSTARLVDPGDADDTLSARLAALAMHLFGRLNGLAARGAAAGFMHPFSFPRDLDRMSGFDDDEVRELRRQLRDVADLRVEERPDAGRPLAFYLRSLAENTDEVPASVWRMRPWLFPLRLSRMTTGAVSAMVVLLMTAEAWELALSLTVAQVAVLSLLAWLAASAYLLKAQRLLAHAHDRVLREQRVVSNVGTVLAVGVGMAVTYLAVFAVAWLAGTGLFSETLLAGWIGLSGDINGAGVRGQMAGFVAAMSLGIGALGASFEPHGYFRHVTHIDDEL